MKIKVKKIYFGNNRNPDTPAASNNNPLVQKQMYYAIFSLYVFCILHFHIFFNDENPIFLKYY